MKKRKRILKDNYSAAFCTGRIIHTTKRSREIFTNKSLYGDNTDLCVCVCMQSLNVTYLIKYHLLISRKTIPETWQAPKNAFD